ncbi:phosphatase PAP2 family protein [Streptomyces sp. NPDC050560]|uniref:phosphatase PAP2 family protein n=1 Tax=Streptomyces sp. NPDC050560 TaxID=3365630 RepID=UPI00378ABC09
MRSARQPAPPDPGTSRGAWVLAAASAAALGVLLGLVAARWPPLLSLDGSLARAAHRAALAHPAATHVNRIFSDWVWDPWTWRAVEVLVALWLLWRGASRTALWLPAAGGLGALAQQGLKAAVDRPRPVWRHPVDSAGYAAFPSGHAVTAVVACGLLLWLLRRRGVRGPVWAVAVGAAAVSVAGVGFTRVWLGVHWASDVVGGWLLGALVVSLAAAVGHRWRLGSR